MYKEDGECAVYLLGDSITDQGGDIAKIHTVIIIVPPPDYTKLFNFQFWEKRSRDVQIVILIKRDTNK
jgi:hypothetical protein